MSDDDFGKRWPLGPAPFAPWESGAQQERKAALETVRALCGDMSLPFETRQALWSLADLGARHDKYRHRGGWLIVDESTMVEMRAHIKAMEAAVERCAESRNVWGDIDYVVHDLIDAVENEKLRADVCRALGIDAWSDESEILRAIGDLKEAARSRD